MLRLSIHTFIIATLLTSMTAFGAGVEKDKKTGDAVDASVRESLRKVIEGHSTEELAGDKMFATARAVLKIKDSDSKKVDPELAKLIDVKGNEQFWAKATPATVKFIQDLHAGQKASSDPKKATADAWFLKMTDALVVAHVAAGGKDGDATLKDWDLNSLKQMPGAYSVEAERNEVGMATFSLAVLLRSVIDGKPISPTKSEVEGGALWIQKLRPDTTIDDARKESQDLLRCRGLKS